MPPQATECSDHQRSSESKSAVAPLPAPECGDRPAAAAASVDNSKDSDAVFEYTPPHFFSSDSRVPGWLQQCITDVYIFVTVHYNLWMIPCAIALIALYYYGYGLVVLASIAVYMTSLLDGAEKTAHGRPWEGFRQSRIWRMLAAFIKLRVMREQALEPTKKYVFGFHPHGIVLMSLLATYGGTWETVFPGVTTRALGATTIFFIPFAREICLWLGAVDASRATADKVLRSKVNSVSVYPGGIPEIFLTNPNTNKNKVVLSNRLGFVKLAIRHGAELVPTFVFGEKWCFNVWTPPENVVAFVRKVLKIPLIIFWGRFLWMPKRLPAGKTFGVVYGKPIATVQKDEPTEEDIRAVHAQYVSEIERIFEQYKDKFGYDADEKLVIL